MRNNMKKLILITILLLTDSSFAWGGCYQVQPLCLYPQRPVCINAGVSAPDYWICG